MKSIRTVDDYKTESSLFWVEVFASEKKPEQLEMLEPIPSSFVQLQSTMESVATRLDDVRPFVVNACCIFLAIFAKKREKRNVF